MNGKRVHKFEVGQGGFGGENGKEKYFSYIIISKKSIVQVT